MKLKKKYARIETFPWKVIENNVVIIDTSDNRALKLSEVAAAIWSCLDGTKGTDEITEDICQRFLIKKAKARKDTVRFLDILVKEELIREV
jgi:ferritin-like protein